MDQDLVGPGATVRQHDHQRLEERAHDFAGDAVERLVRAGRPGNLHQRLGDRARRFGRADQSGRQRGLSDQWRGGGPRRHPATSAGKMDKLSLQLKFKSAYGPAELEYDLFGGDAVDRFDTLILDSVLNYSWMHSSRRQPARQRQVYSGPVRRRLAGCHRRRRAARAFHTPVLERTVLGDVLRPRTPR